MPTTTVQYRPTIYSAPTLDVTNPDGGRIEFTYFGGVITESTATFKDPTTNVTVDTITTQTNGGLYCYIPPVTTGLHHLQNGHSYLVTVQVKNSNTNTQSLESESVLMYCYSEPTLELASGGLPPPPSVGQDPQIAQSYWQFPFIYSQAQNLPLTKCTFTLYNSLRKKISSETIYYTQTYNQTQHIQYLVKNLEDQHIYTLEVRGETYYDLSVTYEVQFSVSYDIGVQQKYIELQNNPEEGTISIESNIKMIRGTAYPDPPTFINNQEIDLTSDNSYIEFDDEFVIYHDFSMSVIGRNFTPFSDIITMKDNNDGTPYQITISYHIGNFASWNNVTCAYFQLKAFNGVTNYVCYSNYIDVPRSDEAVFLWVRRYTNEGIFEIHTEIMNREGTLNWETFHASTTYIDGVYWKPKNDLKQFIVQKITYDSNNALVSWAPSDPRWVTTRIPSGWTIDAIRSTEDLLIATMYNSSESPSYRVYYRDSPIWWSSVLTSSQPLDNQSFWATKFQNNYYVIRNTTFLKGNTSKKFNIISQSMSTGSVGLISNDQAMCLVYPNRILTSFDGITWRQTKSSDLNFVCAATNGSVLVCVENPSSQSGTSVYWSGDGISWNQYTLLESSTSTPLDFCICDGIRFLAGNKASGQLFYSENGRIWTKIDNPLTSLPISGMCTGGGEIFMLSSRNNVSRNAARSSITKG